MRSTLPAILLTGLVIGALAGCSAPATEDDGLVQVVASTDVYGDIASRIGGDRVEVTSIIEGPAQDPHSYEADARVQLALSRADVVIENGAGYDDFVGTLLDGAGNDDVTVLTAVDVAALDQEPAEGEFNEHVWYDFPSVGKLADEIVSTLSGLDPDGANTFQRNGDEFRDGLAELEAIEATLAAQHDGAGVAITEPVPLYLLEASGLSNQTPPAFSEAIEEGTDVSPTVLAATLALFADGSVALLAYNEQTTGPETEQVESAATAAGVPVVSFTETLPDGEDYLGWMTANLEALSEALG